MIAGREQERRNRSATAADGMARFLLFETLAACFAYPGPGLLWRLHEGTLMEALNAAVRGRADGEQLQGSLAAMGEAIQSVFSGGSGPSLAQEYTHLFQLRVRVPLNETSYGLDRTFARARELADLASLYAAFGMELDPEAGELPDHLGVQLEFLAWLCFKEAYARHQAWEEQAAVCRAARARFLADHLTAWLPRLEQRLAGCARLSFYPAAARLAREAVELEHAACGAGPPTGILRDPVEDAADDLPLACGACPAAGADPEPPAASGGDAR